ncbi:hypothetical protein N7523_000770 [Penicillium sp. IBT 18751x]|nr:hypothetical protein N7523_000770 [Penicillium sp. IBT 18751x]
MSFSCSDFHDEIQFQYFTDLDHINWVPSEHKYSSDCINRNVFVAFPSRDVAYTYFNEPEATCMITLPQQPNSEP